MILSKHQNNIFKFNCEVDGRYDGSLQPLFIKLLYTLHNTYNGVQPSDIPFERNIRTKFHQSISKRSVSKKNLINFVALKADK